ncbi:MAG: molybdate ABC transporter substrate-binding protein [Methanoregula sp.]|nr:molybdate ABC transporter substrate-binding protein [Methanoregula sp.]
MTKNLDKSTTVFIGIALVILFIAAACAGCTSSSQGAKSTAAATTAAPTESILVFAGAGLKAPMEDIAATFTQKYGIGVQYSYGGSGVLITQMNLTHKGDVFIPGSTNEWKTAKTQGLVDSYQLVAYHVPVIVVQKGNPKNIASLKDLAQPGLKVALGDVNATAIGKAGAKMFKKMNITAAVEKNVVTRTPTINELVTIMNAGQADAAILTLDNVNAEKMDMITIPLADNEVLITPIGVTTFTQNSEGATKFVAFVASDEGKAIFGKHGFPLYPDPAYANVQP